MASLDMHPDVLRAINSLANTKLGQRFDKLARKRYGVSGKVLAAKQITGESGGNRNAVSSAGARGISQFIPSTREAVLRKYGVDAYGGPKQAVAALEHYDLDRGVAGYNPGMPTYTNYVLGQKLSGQTRGALKDGPAPGGVTLPGPTSHTVTQTQRTIPGQSFAPERQQLTDKLLLSGQVLNMSKLLAYRQQLDQLRDVPARTETGLKVTKHQGPNVTAKATNRQNSSGHGEILELIHNDGAGKPGYGIKNGQVVNGSQVFSGVWADHTNHVHVAADPKVVVKLGKLAKSMDLHVGENPHFGGVNPAEHVPNSYHDRGMAIDVSGDPAKMDAFAKLVEQYNHGR